MSSLTCKLKDKPTLIVKVFLLHELFPPMQVARDQSRGQVDGNNWVGLCLNVCGSIIARLLLYRVSPVRSPIGFSLFPAFNTQGRIQAHPGNINLCYNYLSLQTCMA